MVVATPHHPEIGRRVVVVGLTVGGGEVVRESIALDAAPPREPSASQVTVAVCALLLLHRRLAPLPVRDSGGA